MAVKIAVKPLAVVGNLTVRVEEDAMTVALALLIGLADVPGTVSVKGNALGVVVARLLLLLNVLVLL